MRRVVRAATQLAREVRLGSRAINPHECIAVGIERLTPSGRLDPTPAIERGD